MLRSLFILSIFGPGLLAALRSRYAALLMYLWFALFRPQDWIWVDITRLRPSLLLGVILLVPSIATGVLPNLTHPISIGMMLFLCSSLASQLTAVQPALGWEWIDFLVRLFLACLLLVTLTSEPKRLVGVLAVIAGSLGFHAAKAGVAYVLGGGVRFADGLAGAFVDNNGYALGAVMIIPLLLATAQNLPLISRDLGWVAKLPLVIDVNRILKWARRGFYLSVPLCMFAILGTYSRGGFLALSTAVLTFLILQRRRFTALSIVMALLTLGVAVVPIPQSYIDRLQTIRTFDEDDSALSRPHFWMVGIQMGLDQPLGIGLRQYEQAYDRYDFLHGRFGHARAVHSSHVQVFAELGFPGAIVWASLFAYAYFVCLRVRARSRNEALSAEQQHFLFTTANALIVSMTGFVIGGAFLALALNDITWLTFGMVAALDRTSSRLCEKKEPTVARRPLRAAPLAFRAVESYVSAAGGKR